MSKTLKFIKAEKGSVQPVSDVSTLQLLLNSRRAAIREPLTAAKVLKTPGLEHLTEEEADQAVESIKKLSIALYESACQNKIYFIDNQQDVNLNCENKAA